jgi:integrase
VVRKKTTAALHVLSTREVQNAAEGDHSDGGGLLLRIRGESASWVLRFTALSGKRREMGLGVARRDSTAQAGHSVASARDLAHGAREFLKRGIDPIDARDGRRAADRQALASRKDDDAAQHRTLARWARGYHERAVEPKMTTKHGMDWIQSPENHVPSKIWNAPIASITAPARLEALSAVRSVENPKLTVPETLQRVRQRLDAVFEDAIFHGHCTMNPAAAVRRKMRETMPAKQKGQFAALPYAEVPGFVARLRNGQGIAARCLEFALLTASRTGEVLGAVWSEFALDAGVWVIPGERMKAGESHTVHLSKQAIAVLEQMRGLDAKVVFPSPTLLDRPMSNMAMLNVLCRMGLSDRTTVHGVCRATFSTWANDTAAARPEVIEACLAHKETDRVRAAYNRARSATSEGR